MDNQPQQDPLQVLRQQLAQAQGQLQNLERVKAKLQSLAHPGSSRQPQDVMVPLGPLAFVPGQISNTTSTLVRMLPTSSDPQAADEALPPLARFEGSRPPLKSVNQGQSPMYVEQSTTEALKTLEGRKKLLEARLISMRSRLIEMASKAVQQRLEDALEISPGESRDGVVVNENNEVVNEEGLPIFEPVEELPPSPPLLPVKGGDNSGPTRVHHQAEGRARLVQGRAPGVVEPFSRSAEERSRTREQRRKWMDEILGKLEAEEGEDSDSETEEATNEAPAASPQSASSTTATSVAGGSRATSSPEAPRLTRTLSSADRPAPIKSVLKPSRPPPAPRASFGSAGIRRGFLNLNPNSPSAKQASEPVSPADSSDGECNPALTCSEELPGTEAKKRKKQVRISAPADQVAEPEPESKAKPAVSASVSRGQSRRREPEDEGVEDDAAAIIEMLGGDLGAIPGLNGNATTQDQEEALHPAPGGRPITRPQERKAEKSDAKLALERTVFERAPPSAAPIAATAASPGAKTTSSAQGPKRTSAFARGFLNHPPRPALAASPAPPSPASAPDQKVSQGVSALERSVRLDEAESARREAAGLPPAVPHARPSKAYAEKLEARKAAENGDKPQAVARAEADKKTRAAVKSARPKNGNDEPVEGRVRFAAGQGEAGPGEDENDQELSIEPQEQDEDSDTAPHPYETRGSSEEEDDDDDDDSDEDWDYGTDDDEEDFDLGLDMEDAETARDAAREYARLRAARGDDGLANWGGYAGAVDALAAGGGRKGIEEHEWEDEIVPLDATTTPGQGGSAGHKISRFKASRLAQAASGGSARASAGVAAGVGLRGPRASALGSNARVNKTDADADAAADEAGHELAHLLQDAENIGSGASLSDAITMDAASRSLSGSGATNTANGSGSGRPLMVIPQLAPVRFPRGSWPTVDDPRAGPEGARVAGAVPLEGESDDEGLDEIMRQRLMIAEDAKNAPPQPMKKKLGNGDEEERKPPAIGRAARSGIEAQAQAETQQTQTQTQTGAPPSARALDKGRDPTPIAVPRSLSRSTVSVPGAVAVSTSTWASERARSGESNTNTSEDADGGASAKPTEPNPAPAKPPKKVSRFMAARMAQGGE